MRKTTDNKTERREKLAELESIIKGYRNRIQCVESDMFNDTHYTRKKERLEEQIAKYQAELNTLEYNRSNGDEIIAECRRHIKRLKKQQLKIRRQVDVEKLLELQAKIKELQESLVVHPCETVFEYGNGRKVPCKGTAEFIINLGVDNSLAVCEDCKKLFDEVHDTHPYMLKGKALKIWNEQTEMFDP